MIKKAYKLFRNEGVTITINRGANYVIKKTNSEYRWMKFMSVRNYLINSIKYDRPADPFDSINVDTTNVDQGIRKSNNYYVISPPRRNGLGKIMGGDWESEDNIWNVESNYVIRGFIQHFIHNKGWEKTAYYQKLNDIGLNNTSIEERLRNYENLYNKIKDDGYIKNDRSINERPNQELHVQDLLEVLVLIGRRGNIYFYNGQHRFAIARVLNLTIPVQVVCRHREWQKTRDEVAYYGLSEKQEDLRCHPDLQDILD